MGISETLAELSRAASVHGHEEGTARLLRRLWGPWLDESRVDTLGNFVGVARGSGREPRARVMVAAHMDCVGFVVSAIEDGGFLRLSGVGRVDRRLLLGQEVEIVARRRLTGVIGSKPPHLTTPEDRKNVPKIAELHVDLGLGESARDLVAVGDPVLYRGDVVALRNGWVSGRYLDDAAGLAAIGLALERLRDVGHEADLVAVGTVGEEAGGCPGAVTAAFAQRPGVAIAVDATFGRSPGQDPTSTYPLGGGPTVGVGPNCHPEVVRLLREAAADAGIAYALEVMPGHTGTDAWVMQTARGGIPTGIVSIPVRYMHTPVETASLDDVKNAGHLLAVAVSRVTWAFVEELSCWNRPPAL